jgi:cell division protein FtsB
MITVLDIELKVYEHFRKNMIAAVPNISWGMGIHECDLFLLKKSGFADEVEIKVSKPDLKKDQGKKHGHKNNLIHGLWFAIPEHLEKDIHLIPEKAGILVISEDTEIDNGRRILMINQLRYPTLNTQARKLTDREVSTLGRLGSLRIWSLKNTLQNQRRDFQHLKDLKYNELYKELEQENGILKKQIQKLEKSISQGTRHQAKLLTENVTLKRKIFKHEKNMPTIADAHDLAITVIQRTADHLSPGG